MTATARQVLFDCHVALDLLEEEKDEARWRVHWTAAITLIRAVGHVLDKEDGKDPLVKQVASEAYRSWKSNSTDHEIFWEFIDSERNNLLKQYRSNVHPLDTVQLAVQLVASSQGGTGTVALEEIVAVEENMYRPILDGPWHGHDARDVLSEAIEWWSRQLDDIDAEVARRANSLPYINPASGLDGSA